MKTVSTKTFVTTERETIWITSIFGANAMTGEPCAFDIENPSRVCEVIIEWHAKERGLLLESLAWDERKVEVLVTRVFHSTIYQNGSNATAQLYR